MTLNRFLALALAVRAAGAAQNSPSPLPTVAQGSPTPLPDAAPRQDAYVGADGDMETLRRELEATRAEIAREAAGTVAGLAARTITRGGADGPVLQLVKRQTYRQTFGMLLSDGTHFVAARARLGKNTEKTLRESGGLAPGCFVRLEEYNYVDDEAGEFVVRDLSIVGAGGPLIGAPTHIKTGDPLPLDVVGEVTAEPTAEPTSEPTHIATGDPLPAGLTGDVRPIPTPTAFPTSEPTPTAPPSTCEGAYVALDTAVKEKEDVLSAFKAVADQNCPFVGDRFAWYVYEAAREGKADVVNYLLEHKADPDVVREDRTTPLYAAAEHGHATIVDSLLKAGARLAPNHTDGRESVNAVYAAVAHCRANATRLIVGAGQPMTPLLANYDTALMVAVERGCAECVEIVARVCVKQDLDRRRRDGLTALHLAAMQGSPAIARSLLHNYASAEPLQRETLRTPLHLAAQFNNADVVHILLDGFGDDEGEEKADINRRAARNVTAAHLAADFLQYDALKALADRGADLELTTDEGATPLHIAARRDNASLIKLLASYDVHRDPLDHSGLTPCAAAASLGNINAVSALLNASAACYPAAAIAAARFGRVEVLDVLLRAAGERNLQAKVVVLEQRIKEAEQGIQAFLAGASPQAQEEYAALQDAFPVGASEDVQREWRTFGMGVANATLAFACDDEALVAAARHGHADCIPILLKHGCNASAAAASAAARFDHADVLRVLVAGGLDVDGRDGDNATALHVAAAHGKINAVRELLPHSNVDARGGPSHATALYLATYGGHLETTKLLLEVSDRTIRSSSGLTPEMVARSRGFTKIITLFDPPFYETWLRILIDLGLGLIIGASVAGHRKKRKLMPPPPKRKKGRKEYDSETTQSDSDWASDRSEASEKSGKSAARRRRRRHVAGMKIETTVPKSEPEIMSPLAERSECGTPLAVLAPGGAFFGGGNRSPRRGSSSSGTPRNKVTGSPMPAPPPSDQDLPAPLPGDRAPQRRNSAPARPAQRRAFSAPIAFDEAKDADDAAHRAFGESKSPAVSPRGDLVVQVLDLVRRPDLVETFRAKGIGEMRLLALKPSDLAELGVAPGPSLDILRAVKALRKSRAFGDVQALVDGAARHQQALEDELRDHRAQLARLRVNLREIPDEMVCPISCEVMKDPVMAMDGHTYERVCIEEWFGTGARTSPATNEPLEATTLLPNHMARSLISVFLEQCRQSQASAELPPPGLPPRPPST